MLATSLRSFAQSAGKALIRLGAPSPQTHAASSTKLNRNELVGMFRAGYHAARKNRTNADWSGALGSADQIVNGSAPLLTGRARETVRNNKYADAIAQAYRRAMSGITPRAAARDPRTGKLLVDLNKAADRQFRRWANRPEFCDVERRKTFREMQALGGEEFGTVGESFAVWRYRRSGMPISGLQIQMLEFEQLAHDLTHNPDNGLEIRAGIEIDADGAAVAYHFHPHAHPLESTNPPVFRVEADRVIHLMRQRRVRQTHGVTAMAAVLGDLWATGKYTEAELFAAWMEACVGLIDASQDEEDSDLGFDDDAEVGETTARNDEAPEGLREEVVFRPGMIAKGDFRPFNPQHPNKSIEVFHKVILHGVSASTGFDYSTITKDFDGSYSARRQGMVKEWEHVDDLEDLQIHIGLGRRIWEIWYGFEVMDGRLPLTWSQFQEDPFAYTEAEWEGRPRRHVDPAKEMAAEKLAIDYRLDNRSNIGNRRNIDWRENFERIAEIRDMAEQLGITLPEDAEGGPKTDASESRPTREPDDPSEDSGASGASGAYGDSGGGASGGDDNARLLAAALASGDEEDED